MFLKLLFYLFMMIVFVESSIILTTSGPVRGKLLEYKGTHYYAYQGIPYAESPEGTRRFQPPVPKQPWNEVFDATKAGAVCPQPEGAYTKDQMSENCLTINIFVPANDTRTLRPAFVDIHGGSFKSNSGNADLLLGPEFLLQRDIIVVTMNFRLGALGFLSFETEEAPGNAGLKDILLALKWFKQNLRNFGGNSITIGGQSSGAASVHYLLMSEKTTGLFDKAVLISGSATNFRFFSKYPKEHALELANELGLGSSSVESKIQNLTNLDVFEIINAQENMYKNDRNVMRTFAPFVPSIEIESPHSVVTRNPIDVIQSGIPQNVPIMTGINSREGIYMWPTLKNKPQKFLKDNFTLCIPSDIEYPSNSELFQKLVDSVRNFYFGGADLNKWNLINFFNLLSDTQYTNFDDSWIRLHAGRRDSQPVYYYLFDFDGDLNWAKINYNISFPGVAHSDDYGYTFITKATRPRLDSIDCRSKRAMDNIVTFLTNFVKSGNPNPVGSSELNWAPCGAHRDHLILNDAPEFVHGAPFAERFDFWYNVYDEYYRYVKAGGETEPRLPPKFNV